MMCFFTPWKHKESFVFGSFQEFGNAVLSQNWVFLYFWYKWFLFCQKMVHFTWNLLIFNFKFFDLALKFLGVIITKYTHKMSPQVCISWLVVMVTAEMLFSMLPGQPSLRVENPCWSTQNKNITLINSPSFNTNWLLFLKINVTKGLFHTDCWGH